jgi:general secretion pathway protein B
MSYILDALRKSERARRLGRAPVYRDGAPPVQTTLLRGLSVAAGVMLVAALAVSAWLLNRPEAPAVIAAESAPVAATAAPAPTPVRPIEAEPQAAAPRATASAAPEQARVASSTATVRGAAGAGTDPARSPRTSSLPAGGAGDAPWLSTLPDDFRASLPPLMVNIHVYAQDERQRILYINNRPLQRGEEIDGIVVEEIVPEGVVLRARGQRFKLPRPS